MRVAILDVQFPHGLHSAVHWLVRPLSVRDEYGSCAAAGQDPASEAGHTRHNKRDRQQSAHRQ